MLGFCAACFKLETSLYRPPQQLASFKKERKKVCALTASVAATAAEEKKSIFFPHFLNKINCIFEFEELVLKLQSQFQDAYDHSLL